MKEIAFLFLLAHAFYIDIAPSWLTLTFIGGVLVAGYFAFIRD